MPTTRQKFLQALGIASAALGLRPATGAPALTRPVPTPSVVAPPSNSRLHIRTAGVYHITVQVEWATQTPPSIHTLAVRLRDQTLAVPELSTVRVA